MLEQSADSLTQARYWDNVWADHTIPSPLDPFQKGLNGVVPRTCHRYFQALFQALDVKPGDLMLEAGCGGSIYPPYFRRHFGLVTEGLDNSEVACSLSEAIAEKCAIPATIVLGDALHPPQYMLGRYRVIVSFGLAEHFRPTTAIVAGLAAMLQPSGYLITHVPNMHGLVGLLQRLANPPVYDMHVPLSPRELAEAHSACGLDVLDARHLLTACFSVINFSGPGSRIPPSIALRLASWVTKSIWILEGLAFPRIPNGLTSPYVCVVARKPPGVSGTGHTSLKSRLDAACGTAGF